MDLRLYFNPLSNSLHEILEQGKNENTMFQAVALHYQDFPDVTGANVAIIGLTECSGTSPLNSGVSKAADAVRIAFYSLKQNKLPYEVVDLGNLISGHDRGETLLRIQAVGEYLMQQNILPLFLGGSHDLDFGQYRAYENLNELINVAGVDARIDMEMPQNTEEVVPADSHLRKILLHEPNYLLHYSHIAYQSFLVDYKYTQALKRFFFDAHRLGMVNADIRAMEPVLRHAHMLTFDIGAIQSQDAAGSINSTPFGLSAQQACQLCWYAGHNEQLTSAGFYEYNPEVDDEQMRTAFVIATMLWYFIEGFYHRKDDLVDIHTHYLKYTVAVEQEDLALGGDQISFFKSKKTEKWWMEIPLSSADGLNRGILVPCSYEDYERTVKGELPERWMQFYNKQV